MFLIWIIICLGSAAGTATGTHLWGGGVNLGQSVFIGLFAGSMITLFIDFFFLKKPTNKG